MPRIVEFEGVQHEFPDNATDAEVSAALEAHSKAAPPSHWDTFKSNMFQAGTIGDYLETASHVLGAPIAGLLHAPSALLDWVKKGGHNEPSGGFLGEDPATQMIGDATAAVLPPDLASAKGAVGDVAAAGKGAIQGGVKAVVTKAPGAYVLERATEALGLPRGVGTAIVAIPGAVKGARAALAARAAVVPEVAADDAALLEGLSQSQLGKSFAKASPEQQATIRDVAARIQAPAPSPAPAYRPPAGLDTSQVPVAQPAPASPPAAPPTAPLSPAAPATGEPSSPLARPDVHAQAQALLDEMKANGYVETPPEAEASTEDFQDRARVKRATDAETMAGALHEAGVPSSRFSTVNPESWSAIAKQIGVEWPSTKAAQTKLIRDTLKALGGKEGPSSVGELMQ